MPGPAALLQMCVCKTCYHTAIAGLFVTVHMQWTDAQAKQSKTTHVLQAFGDMLCDGRQAV